MIRAAVFLDCKLQMDSAICTAVVAARSLTGPTTLRLKLNSPLVGWIGVSTKKMNLAGGVQTKSRAESRLNQKIPELHRVRSSVLHSSLLTIDITWTHNVSLAWNKKRRLYTV